MLTIQNYDHSVIEYFNSFYEYVVWGTTDVAFKNAALKWEDSVPLPLISVYRSDLKLQENRNFALYKKGKLNGVTPTTVNRERILPLILSYQADIWAQDLEQCTQMFAEVLFRTLDKPMIPVKHEGKEEATKKELRLLEVIDNNDSTQISSRGRLYRFSLTYQMDGYVTKLVENDRIYIRPSFHSYDGKTLS